MGVRYQRCVYVVCDGADDCDPWDDDVGTPHFDSLEKALEYVRSYGWIVAGDRLLCPDHAAKQDCALTGHRYDPWQDKELRGVQYRTRWCEHCNHTDYDPPFGELSLLMHAAEQIDGTP